MIIVWVNDVVMVILSVDAEGVISSQEQEYFVP